MLSETNQARQLCCVSIILVPVISGIKYQDGAQLSRDSEQCHQRMTQYNLLGYYYFQEHSLSGRYVVVRGFFWDVVLCKMMTAQMADHSHRALEAGQENSSDQASMVGHVFCFGLLQSFQLHICIAQNITDKCYL